MYRSKGSAAEVVKPNICKALCKAKYQSHKNTKLWCDCKFPRRCCCSLFSSSVRLLTKSINILCVSVFTFVAVNILCSFFCTRYMSPSFGVNISRISRHGCLFCLAQEDLQYSWTTVVLAAILTHPAMFLQNIFTQQRARSLRPPEPRIPELRRKGKEDLTNTGRRAEETTSCR